MSDKKIVIRIRIPAVPRRRWLIALALTIVAVGAVAFATDFTPFAQGEQLGKTKMNMNFQVLQDRIATLETKAIITRNSKKWSLGAVFCGRTSPTTGQIANGYAGAKALCETSCASPSAHMCTSEDVIRSAQMGITVQQGWYSTFTNSIVGTNQAAEDCVAWTSAAAGVSGAFVPTGTFFPNSATCDQSFPVICCD